MTVSPSLYCPWNRTRNWKSSYSASMVVLTSRSCNIWDCVLLNQLGFVMFDSQNHIKHYLSHKAVMNCINVFM